MASQSNSYSQYGKVAVDINELKNVQSAIKYFIDELDSVSNVLNAAYNSAVSAASLFTQSYVQTAANNVITRVDSIVDKRNRVVAALKDLNFGIKKAIDGYPDHEDSLV